MFIYNHLYSLNHLNPNWTFCGTLIALIICNSMLELVLELVFIRLFNQNLIIIVIMYSYIVYVDKDSFIIVTAAAVGLMPSLIKTLGRSLQFHND